MQINPFNHDFSRACDYLYPALFESIHESVLPFLQTIYEPGDVFEVRGLKATGAPNAHSPFKSTHCGYFTDLNCAARSIAILDHLHDPAGVYFTINPVKPDLLARAANQTEFNVKTTATDADVTRRRWLVLDFDPQRVSGVSSTDAELKLARDLAERVQVFLAEQGWGEPLRVMSGNGYHLWYRINLPADDGGLVSRVLGGLASIFTDDAVDLDTTVYNPSRIMKVPGTMARKGSHFLGSDGVEPRPHRRSRWENPGTKPLLVEQAKLEALADELKPKKTEVARPKASGTAASRHREPRAHVPLPQLEPITAGCSFMRHVVDDAVSLSEPEWYAGLSIMGRCEEGVSLAHQHSEAHPGYDPDKTQKKLEQALEKSGPRTCESIRDGLNWSGCETCPHAGKIKSPIQLGRDRSPATALEGRCLEADHYRVDTDGIYHVQHTERHGPRETRVANFAAWISAERTLDDGEETTRMFDIEAYVGGRWLKASVDAEEFDDLKWVTRDLGSDAVIMATPNAKHHARAAIQLLSGDGKDRVTCFTHTGWREVGGQWVYLHGGGALGADGEVDGLSTQLPGYLEPVSLVEPTSDDLSQAVRESLELIDLGPDAITVPVLGGVYRSVLGRSGVNLHLLGSTGVYKSQVAALAQAHFGAGFDDSKFPASWKDTGYALMSKGFHAKDMLMVVDDFKPVGSQYDRQKLIATADSLFRGNANGAGRGRLTRSGKDRAQNPPRTLVLSTGEDTFLVNSLQARVWEVPVKPGDIDTRGLTQSQERARAGRYVLAMTGYIRWLAEHHQEHVAELPNAEADLRSQLDLDGHKRTGSQAAQLLMGWTTFLEFAQEVGAVTDAQAEVYRERAVQSLVQQGEHQSAMQEQTKPAERFLELLGSAISTGQAHVEGIRGESLDHREHWGWRRGSQGAFQPQGDMVGWLDGDDLYLDLTQALKVAQRAAGSDNQSLAMTERMLSQHLHESRFLASNDLASRASHKVRKSCGGSRQNVLHLRASDVVDSDEPKVVTPSLPLAPHLGIAA